MGLKFLNGHPYLILDRFIFFQDLVIPESEDMKTCHFQMTGTDCITFSKFNMLTSINFNHQFERQTNKIKDVIAERMLSAEFVI